MTTSHLELDTRRISRQYGAARMRAQRILDTQVMRDTDPYVPMDVGMLKGHVEAESPGTIVYPDVYAAAQYYGLPNKAHDKHPLATMMWFAFSKSANLVKWLRVAKRAGGTR